MRVIFACGGTGGHIYPAVAVADELKRVQTGNFTALFVGSADGMEKDIVPARGYEFKGLDVRPLIRKITLRNFVNAWCVVRSLFECVGIIRRFRPDYVMGTGGFASFPVIMAAALMGKRTLIHEPNVVPGLANKALSFFAEVVSVGFADSKKYFPAKKVRVTGNPVRESLLSAEPGKGYAEFGLDPRKKTVLIMPGSRAAKKINQVALQALPLLQNETPKIQFLWMCGSEAYDNIMAELQKSGADNVKLMKFIEKAELAYSIADCGILRAGASTLSEITAIGLPAILVPYPHATGNHQEKNALAFVGKGAAILVKDSGLTPENMAAGIRQLLAQERNAAMRKMLKASYAGNGAKNIAEIIGAAGL